MSVRLISREEAFERSPVLANAVIGWQQAEYNDVKNDLDAEDLEWFKERLDNVSSANPEIEYCGEILLAPQENTLESLLSAFQTLNDRLQVKEVIFIPVFKDSWLRQSHSYSPVKKALEYIERVVVDKDYFEGIVADSTDLKEMLTSIFWISRCCASMCDIYCSLSGTRITFSICKYGVLHFTLYNEKEKDNFKLCLLGSGLKQTEKCSDIYSETAITGRQIIV
ncbi:MAG: hypothetical protein JNL72_04650 [Flavipsychrobacter sp.]|nr:hypothetical protein [Flavipsychrobacter sp.]